MHINAKQAEFLIQQLKVLVVDDSAYMRNVVRGLLGTIGVKRTHEAADGIAALEKIREVMPDIVIIDWDMPLLSGPELVRIVRSPGVFPTPDVPIIMMSENVERSRVFQASRLGVNEFLCKPMSAKALLERLISILLKPRENVRVGDYYGPAPRKPAVPKDKPLDSPTAA